MGLPGYAREWPRAKRVYMSKAAFLKECECFSTVFIKISVIYRIAGKKQVFIAFRRRNITIY